MDARRGVFDNLGSKSLGKAMRLDKSTIAGCNIFVLKKMCDLFTAAGDPSVLRFELDDIEKG